MIQLAFAPVNDDPGNPTTRLRCIEVARALRGLGVAADLLRDGEPSEVLIWGRRDWAIVVVLPVPLTPTTRTTKGSCRRAGK